jgi:hypothetical protein
MSKTRLQVLSDCEAIKSQLRKDEKFSQAVRMYAVYQIASGKTAEELKDFYGWSVKK